MNRGSRMIRTTSIYFIGNFASKLLAFFLLPIYTTYLTTEDFGQVDLFMSALPLIAPIFTMQVTETIFRFLCTEETIEGTNRTITNAIVIFISGILIFIFLYIPFVLKFQLSYAILFFMYFVVTYVGIFLQQVLRGLQRTIEYAVTGVIATVVNATLNIVLIVIYGMGGESLLLASTGASLVIVMIIALRIKIWRFIDGKLLSIKELKRQLRYGVPLIPNQICWWVIGLMGKYILLYFSGSDANGIFAVASKFPGLLITINSIFFLAWTENIILEFESKDRDDYFSNAFMKFMIFSLSAAACLLPMIKIYNVMTISGDFITAWKYIPVLIAGALFNSLAGFLGTIYTASMKTASAFTTTVIAAVANLVLSILMTPFISIWGVALANMLSFIILFVVRIKSVNRIINLQIEFIQLFPSTFLLIVSIIGYYYLNIVLQSVFFITVVICALFMNKEVVVAVLRSVGIIKDANTKLKLNR